MHMMELRFTDEKEVKIKFFLKKRLAWRKPGIRKHFELIKMN